MRNIIKPALSLFVICFVVALFLSVVNYFTEGVIKDRALKDAEVQRKQVLAEAESFQKVDGWQDMASDDGLVKEVYKGIKEGKTNGYVFSLSPKGYGGEILVTVGISADGSIQGVNVGENKETPGLGTKAAQPGFTDQYKNKKAGDRYKVVKGKASSDNEIEAISGATITSRAVTSAVQAAADLANELIKKEADVN